MALWKEMSADRLQQLAAELEQRYQELAARKLKLDMSRGKPSAKQLDLCSGAAETLRSTRSRDGIDARNYGTLEGLPEMREFFGELLGLDPESIIVGGNASLNLMYDTLVRLMLFGTLGNRPWKDCAKVKFLCPCPGYDRHFAICEQLGIEMINVPMTAAGPDLARIETFVADPAVKGIWCVPLYSNPQGICYSDETVKRLGAMKCAAPDFRIFWDNAYGVHHLYDEKTSLYDVFKACRDGGNPERAYYFFSTSKITFPGGGVAMMAAGPESRKEALKRMGVQTIGYDKLNQLRTLQFLPTPAALHEHMAKLAAALRPNFEIVTGTLERELGGTGLASWSRPRGGYFVALDTMPGCAAETIRLAAAAGVKLTGAGATFPYHKDPDDTNIRIAPSYPTGEELTAAMELFVICLKLAGVRKLLGR